MSKSKNSNSSAPWASTRPELFLKLARRQSMSEVARKAKISVSHLSKIFSGDRTPSLPAAKRIAQAFRISLDKLQRTLESA